MAVISEHEVFEALGDRAANDEAARTTNFESLPSESFEKATVFESGYLMGFSQFEVRRVRFHIAKRLDGAAYPVATFVRRGRRKEETVALERLVVVRGWSAPTLETAVELSADGAVRAAKFTFGSPEWNTLLDEYLAELKPENTVLSDGRTLAGPLTRHSAPLDAGRMRRSAQDPNSFVTTSADGALVDASFSEGAPESALLTRYERDPKARSACLAHYGYGCRACGVTMSDIYGAIGQNYVHVHHRVPLSDSGFALSLTVSRRAPMG